MLRGHKFIENAIIYQIWHFFNRAKIGNKNAKKGQSVEILKN